MSHFSMLYLFWRRGGAAKHYAWQSNDNQYCRRPFRSGDYNYHFLNYGKLPLVGRSRVDTSYFPSNFITGTWTGSNSCEIEARSVPLTLSNHFCHTFCYFCLLNCIRMFIFDISIDFLTSYYMSQWQCPAMQVSTRTCENKKGQSLVKCKINIYFTGIINATFLKIYNLQKKMLKKVLKKIKWSHTILSYWLISWEKKITKLRWISLYN